MIAFLKKRNGNDPARVEISRCTDSTAKTGIRVSWTVQYTNWTRGDSCIEHVVVYWTRGDLLKTCLFIYWTRGEWTRGFISNTCAYIEHTMCTYWYISYCKAYTVSIRQIANTMFRGHKHVLNYYSRLNKYCTKLWAEITKFGPNKWTRV
jgi:glycosyltransferase involved in cell wall biosynthesis